MGLILGVCDYCGEKIREKEIYAITKDGKIACLTCSEDRINKVLAYKKAEELEKTEKKERKKK